MEQWRDVKGFEGAYEVSNYGNVRSITREVKDNGGTRTTYGTLLRGEICKGYLRVALCHSSFKKRMFVHRLVAIAFIDNSEKKRTVNHIDGNKLNNKVDNLEWATHKENIGHAFLNGLKVIGKPNLGRIGNLCHKSKSVLQLNLNGEIINKF